MINLKQANYKPIKIVGKARLMPASEAGVQGTVFLGVASHVLDREVSLGEGLIVSRHAVDMKFLETPTWFTSVAGYTSTQLVGASFFDLVHSGDAEPVFKAFKNGMLQQYQLLTDSPQQYYCYCSEGARSV